jgi:hypothetical protein
MVERQHLEPHALGPLDASARHALDRPRRGSGLMRRGLFESVWLGSQAFFGAETFDQNIGAWNTAKMTAIDNVGALCLFLWRVCFMLACVLHSFLEYCMRT